MTNKQIVEDLLQRIPEGASLHDIAQEIEFVAAVRLVLGTDNALLAEQFDGLVDITAGLIERALAIHDARAALLTEALHVFGCDHFLFPLFVLVGRASTKPAVRAAQEA